jgi:predicted NBD/HSP70 family sugar kinase
MMAVYVPERIVLSGGVMKSYDLLEATIQNILKRDNPMIPASQVQIMPAKLGYFAGAIGAAYALKQATQI